MGGGSNVPRSAMFSTKGAVEFRQDVGAIANKRSLRLTAATTRKLVRIIGGSHGSDAAPVRID